jgi:hypothetical protein
MSKAKDLNERLSSILDEIEQRNVEAELKESRIPQIGIFYVVKGDVLIDAVPANEISAHRDIKVYVKIHRDWWKEIQSGLNSLKPLTTGKSYDYYPRGRVTYVESEDKYIIFLDPCITKGKTKEIVKSFNLPPGKYEVRVDPHYKCNRCNNEL